jgi:hypothetical protein
VKEDNWATAGIVAVAGIVAAEDSWVPYEESIHHHHGIEGSWEVIACLQVR